MMPLAQQRREGGEGHDPQVRRPAIVIETNPGGVPRRKTACAANRQ